ncbi:MAG: nitronate monooxygenase [Moraxella sp.]|nr:nitronate monooxygenase [Moraxella sp.]
MSIAIGRLSLPTPIVQAPMAGASNADFVIKACQLGVLGSLGAGMMSAAQIDDEINKIKAGADQAFNINLMILSKTLTEQYEQSMPEWLSALYAELGITPTLDDKPAHAFDEQFAVLLRNPVPAASFTFGILTQEQVLALHEVGTIVIGTANNTDEVQSWQAVGADAVVVQGVGAGGHQGGWLYGESLDTFELLTKARVMTDLPLIAAGGVASRRELVRLLDAGADLVAVGTAFLTTKESPINAIWKDKILNARADDTGLTRLYSGKWARGIITGYMNRFAKQDNDDLPVYPTLNAMTKPLRAHANSTKDDNFMSLWCGVGASDCRDESMAQLVDRLMGR